MDSSMGGIGGSGDEDTHNSHREKRSFYKRLSPDQTAILEKFIMECPHPDEAQRQRLASEIGLEPKQIKFWFQNKRTQLKNQHERADNNALRVENDKIHSENLAIREALKNTLCPSCGGPPFHEGEHALHMQKMQRKNAQLKEEIEKVSSHLAKYLERQISQPSSVSLDLELGKFLNQRNDGSPSLDQSHGTPRMNDCVSLHKLIESSAREKALMFEIATTATEELVRLLCINEPFWVNSLTQDGKLTLHRETYDKFFPKFNHFKGANMRVESSKDSGIVNLSGIQLVEMFLDPDKWINLFPTIVTKAETIKVIESGLENRSGALQLMNEEMHVLSPLVQPREFHFLRYCQQVEVGVWVITDVSIDSSQQNTPLSRSWRNPSGCMIQEIPNAGCRVTWVENVEVDDKIQTHRLYTDLVGMNILYGAERWIKELQRMCKRFASYWVRKIPNHDFGGVIYSLEGRRSVMKLAHRMIKMFCESLTMSGKIDFPHLNVENNSGVRIFIRKSTGIGEPNGTVIVAASSLWLPLNYEKVFEFLTNDKRRPQWDILAFGNSVHQIAHISNGIHHGNYVSIIQPYIPIENSAMILQESFVDHMGSYVVYAPTDSASMNMAIAGEDISRLSILPSGFVISSDGQPNATSRAFNNGNANGSGGSLLTVVFQILACGPNEIKLLNIESLRDVKTLLTSTVRKIKDALNCNSSE